MSLAPIGSASAQIYNFTTIAGTAGNDGSDDGTNGDAQFYSPISVAVDTNGNVYVADWGNSTIRKIAPVGANWVVSTIAGSAGNQGYADGTNNNAQFNQSSGIAMDTNGNVYVADTSNSTIRKITPVGADWVTTTIAGSAGNWGSDDGTNSAARFLFPAGIAVDGSGNLYVADTWNYTIRKITPVGADWVTTTIAGTVTNSGSADGTNSAARFNAPVSVAVDTNGNVYVVDGGNDTIRKITPVETNWVVSTIAGLAGNEGSVDGTNSAAQFNHPFSVAVDTNGNLYVADMSNNTIRKVTPVVGTTNWVTTTIGGAAGVSGATDCFNGYARFSSPSGVVLI